MRLPLRFFFANLVLLSLLRVAFFYAYRGTAGHLAAHDLLMAFYLGLKFDARLAAILTFPLLVLRRGTTAYVAIVELAVLLLYAADFGSYSYIHQRLNAGVLEFLRNPLISLHMVWESYHVVLFGLTILAVVVLIAFAARRSTHMPKRQAGASWLLAIALLACIYGKISRYPLRWSDAYFSRNPFIGELALNPAQYLFETMREKPAGYDEAGLRRLYPIVTQYLGITHPDAKTLNLQRQPPVHSQTTGTPNIVLIQLESFAAFKTGSFGNKMDASPNIDDLASHGYLFTQHFSPSEKTARALFSVIFGIADVSPWQASAHNPLTVNQQSIINDFTGYEKFYFLGGSANWSNIRGMLAHNLGDLHMYEEGSYRAPAVDVWGISDEELFLAANEVLRTQQKPFFAIIQTSANHRPYTIPKQTHGFPVRHLNEDVLRANGFESNDEYNSFRYLDHSVGLFLQAARRERYFDNTIFVLYGDHGTRTGAPAGQQQEGDLSQVAYHVPLIIYAPRFLTTPRRIDTPSSHVDILPTVASLCGRPYTDRTIGIDVLDPALAGRSAAFIFTTFHDPPDLELVDATGTTIVRSGDMRPNLARALYESSRWLLFHNH